MCPLLSRIEHDDRSCSDVQPDPRRGERPGDRPAGQRGADPRRRRALHVPSRAAPVLDGRRGRPGGPVAGLDLPALQGPGHAGRRRPGPHRHPLRGRAASPPCAAAAPWPDQVGEAAVFIRRAPRRPSPSPCASRATRRSLLATAHDGADRRACSRSGSTSGSPSLEAAERRGEIRAGRSPPGQRMDRPAHALLRGDALGQLRHGRSRRRAPVRPRPRRPRPGPPPWTRPEQQTDQETGRQAARQATRPAVRQKGTRR